MTSSEFAEQTRGSGSPLGREVLTNLVETFCTGEVEDGQLWTQSMLRRCVGLAAVDLIWLHAHDFPEDRRADFAELIAMFRREERSDARETAVASVRALNDDEIQYAFGLIAMLAVAMDAVRVDRTQLH